MRYRVIRNGFTDYTVQKNDAVLGWHWNARYFTKWGAKRHIKRQHKKDTKPNDVVYTE
jgi:hypothetical protein